MAALT
jgi:hypothetical protein